MTLSEAKDILVNRIGWKDDKTLTGFVLSPANETSQSGTTFQDEHAAVRLETIKDCQAIPKISDADFNTYLEELRASAVMHVLNDALERDYIKDNLLTLYPSIFDAAIRLRMVVVIGEMIMTTARSNETARVNKALAAKMNYDLYRDSVQKFANSRATYKYAMGVATRYGVEIEKLQRRVGSKSMFKTITKGQA